MTLAVPASASADTIDLAVAQTDAPDPAMAGQPLTYSIQATNAGPDPAANVRVIDTLSHRVTFLAVDSPSCIPGGRRVVCTFAELAAGETQAISVQVVPDRAARPYTAVNSVSISERRIDSQLSNNTVREGTRIESPPPVRCAGRIATILGTSGNDSVVGTAGNDVIALFGGDDRVIGLGGNDLICGSGGRDSIRGGGGADILRGGRGSDVCRGGRGPDIKRSC